LYASWGGSKARVEDHDGESGLFLMELRDKSLVNYNESHPFIHEKKKKKKKKKKNK
jgi:hypothetical protein